MSDRMNGIVCMFGGIFVGVCLTTGYFLKNKNSHRIPDDHMAAICEQSIRATKLFPPKIFIRPPATKLRTPDILSDEAVEDRRTNAWDDRKIFLVDAVRHANDTSLLASLTYVPWPWVDIWTYQQERNIIIAELLRRKADTK